jgi:hypothetical protein
MKEHWDTEMGIAQLRWCDWDVGTAVLVCQRAKNWIRVVPWRLPRLTHFWIAKVIGDSTVIKAVRRDERKDRLH